MCARRMHADEVAIDTSLVRRLLAGQFPQWADLPIEPVPSAGTDNALYRLGGDMVVRLPRIHWAVGDLIVAWNLLPGDVRDVFPAALGVDDATWARGRGWALSVALIQLPYYKDTNPTLAANARHVIREILAGGWSL